MMDKFFNQVKAQLQSMSEQAKDAWILRQAKLTQEDRQADFLMTLTGEKHIMDMPSEEEIDAFCRKAEAGEIYFEYMTRYCEFDDDGRYMDDWKIWHKDPFGAAGFLDRVFIGCHGLMLLEEYRTVTDALEKVLNLRFQMETAEDSEDSAEDDFFSVAEAEKEGLFSVKLSDVGRDWILAYTRARERQAQAQGDMAVKLLEMLEHPACRQVKPRILLGENVSQQIFSRMAELLEQEIEKLEKKARNENARECWRIRGIMERKEELLSDLYVKCIKAEPSESVGSAAPDLEEAWKRILALIQWLRYEYVIDDQLEIDEILDICEGLIQSGRLGREKWEIRRAVLSDMLDNDYYDYYNCGDVMKEMAEHLCIGKAEHLQLAAMMEKRNAYQERAAELYHQYGREDKYVSYLEGHLGRSSRHYSALIAFYREKGQTEEAKRVARLGLENCREDLTDCFVFLLQKAKEEEDEAQFKKLYASAKRRKNVDVARVCAEVG